MRFRRLITLLAVIPVAAHAEGFERDIDYVKATKLLLGTRFGDLAVGTKAYASVYDLCYENDLLYLKSFEPVSEPAEYTAGILIELLPTRSVDASIYVGDHAGETAKRSLLTRMAALEDCDTFIQNVPNLTMDDFLLVSSVDGYVSLGPLIVAVAEEDVASTGAFATSENAHTKEGNDDESWLLLEEKDKITDQPNVFLIGISDNLQTTIFGQEWTPRLSLRCMRNTSSAYLQIEEYIISDRIPVSYRIDGDEPREEIWSVASNRKAIGLWSGAGSIPLMKSLLSGDELTMRVQTDDSVYTFSFPLGGLRPKIERIAQACNWDM